MTDKAKRGGAYTAEENKAIAAAYVALAVAQYQDRKASKAELIRQLQAGPVSGRSRGSIEAKFMNYSAAAVAHGLLPGLPFGYVKGYKPAPNRQKGLESFLLVAIEQSERPADLYTPASGDQS